MPWEMSTTGPSEPDDGEELGDGDASFLLLFMFLISLVHHHHQTDEEREEQEETCSTSEMHICCLLLRRVSHTGPTWQHSSSTWHRGVSVIYKVEGRIMAMVWMKPSSECRLKPLVGCQRQNSLKLRTLWCLSTCFRVKHAYLQYSIVVQGDSIGLPFRHAALVLGFLSKKWGDDLHVQNLWEHVPLFPFEYTTGK